MVEKKPNANIGITTGEKSGWLALDVTWWQWNHICTWSNTWKTSWYGYRCYRRWRLHYIFKYSQGRSIPNKTKFAPDLDTRSTDGLIVVAPSIHVSGNQYQWLEGHSPFDRTPAEAPEWLLKLMEREEVLLTPFEGSSIIVEIKEGNRNSTWQALQEPWEQEEWRRKASIRHYLQKTTQGAILRLMKRKLRKYIV